MKNSLIITAQPSPKGFVHNIAQSYAKGIKASGGKAEILDLYAKKNHQPFLKFEDIKEWPQENLQNMQKKIKEADEIVFCFPVWWGDAPAILKNWLDYNFTSGFAFKYDPKGVIKLLKGKQAKVLATSDAPGFAYGSILSPMRIMWCQLRLSFCGIKTSHFKVFGNMRKRDEANKTKLLKEVELLTQK